MRISPHRSLRIALIPAALFAVAAAPASAQAPAPAKPPREELTIDPATILQPWKGDLDGMAARRMVRVLVVPSKTFYFNDHGTQRGITYDTFQLLEKELNRKIAGNGKSARGNLKVKFFFVPVGRGDIFEALRQGKGDIAAANLSITPQRQALVDFAAPVMTGVRELVVTGPASPALSALDDLAGREIFVRKSSSYWESLVGLNKRFAAEGKPPVKLEEAPDELEDEDLIEMLSAGLVPTLVVDEHIARFWKRVFPKIVIHETIAVGTEGNIAWAIRRDSPKLKAFLDGAAAAITTGHLEDEREWILTKYLKRLTHVKSAAAEAQRKKFLSLVGLFRKYGDRYDVNWLLMAAQGYQESRLDQNARSPSGAIGVMQVLPSTARDMKVGDITQTEPNINAGVKYMRFMIDQYYAKEPMTKLDKALFAFAAYNAGPGRVAQLRREAARRSLDPNVWFHNVEYVAEEKIGHETVTYVSNIFKYYVAYQLIEDTLKSREQAKKTLEAGSR
ncbi:MAG TPA: transporter substrate-binding domain-containing protein [Thermoanaerobaculia bacterium]|nr:transporter substrate-binding domain-containing protein [Thermoanaerobaculia bacterium]